MLLARHAPLVLAGGLIAVLAGCFGPRLVDDRWPDGRTQRHGQLVSGLQHGHWTYWHANGARRAEGDWAEDKLAGTWTWWDDAGKLQHRGGYASGLRTGTWEHFHPGGTLASTGTYLDDRQQGRWHYQDPQGATTAEGWFDRGVRHGLWRISDKTGQSHVGLYLAGRPVGPWSVGGATGGDHLESQALPPGCTLVWAADHRSWTITGPDRTIVVTWPASGAAGFRIMAGGVSSSGELMAGRPLALPSIPTPATNAPPLSPAPGQAANPVPPPAPPPAPATIPPPESVAISPVPVPPDILTTKERRIAATLVQAYTHGKQALVDSEYAVNPADASGGAAESKALVGKSLPQTRFLTASGAVVDLEEATRPTVVVLMRGFSGQVCVYCATQTTAIADNVDRFTAAGADILVVYPGPTEAVPAFVAAIQTLRTDPPPMPIGLDVSLLLVRGLGVEDNLARPTSLIIQPGGRIGYAYIGTSNTDRPSVDALLEAVSRLKTQGR